MLRSDDAYRHPFFEYRKFDRKLEQSAIIKRAVEAIKSSINSSASVRRCEAFVKWYRVNYRSRCFRSRGTHVREHDRASTRIHEEADSRGSYKIELR